MTSDVVQNHYIAKEHKDTQKRSFLATANLLPSFFYKPRNLPSAHTGNQEEMRDLLKSAYTMLEQAEKKLNEKEKRIQNLERIMTIDELTGLTNRRGFYSAFRKELDRTNRGQSQGGLLIMVDLDFFKTINDTFGHAAGDKALQIIGCFLNEQIRDMDVAARLGGDEFILLMPDTSIVKAMRRAQALGDALNALSFEWAGATIHIHASLGLQEYNQGDTIETIIHAADEKMYTDKKNRMKQNHQTERIIN